MLSEHCCPLCFLFTSQFASTPDWLNRHPPVLRSSQQNSLLFHKKWTLELVFKIPKKSQKESQKNRMFVFHSKKEEKIRVHVSLTASNLVRGRAHLSKQSTPHPSPWHLGSTPQVLCLSHQSGLDFLSSSWACCADWYDLVSYLGSLDILKRVPM